MEKLLEKYFNLKQQEEEIKKEKDLLSKEIKSKMTEKSFIGTKYKASLTGRVSYNYIDELAIIKYLKLQQNSRFIVEVIDNKALNAEIKKEGIINTDLSNNGLIEKNICEVLSVSEVN